MTKNRCNVLKHYLFTNKNGVKPSELLRFIFDSSYSKKAKDVIEKIDIVDVYYVVKFRNVESPLYYPKEYSLKSLDTIIVESFYPSNWHYYESYGTLVKSTDIIVDCGAAEGLFSLLASRRCQKIYLIEPLQQFINSLQITFSNIQKAEILPYALSDKEFSAQMTACDISSCLSSAKGEGETKVTTLDKLFFEKGIRISFIKADLEGYDLRALKGAANLIRENNPKIAITTYHNINHASQIAKYLQYINPDYKIKLKGIYQQTGSPMMLHAWV